jgi:hypothetical protein
LIGNQSAFFFTHPRPLPRGGVTERREGKKIKNGKMTYYDYDEGPQLDLLQVILGFVLGMMVCGLISIMT